MITTATIDAAIERWLNALARVPLRSTSGVLASAAQLGCRVSGGAAPAPRLVGLHAAERPMVLLSGRERQLLVAKYWEGSRWVSVDAEVEGKVRQYPRRCWRADKDVALELGYASAGAVKKAVHRARGKIRAMLEGGR